MTNLDEQKEISKIMNFMEEGNEEDTVSNSFLDRKLTADEIKKFSDTLKAEIVFARNSFGNGEILTTNQIWKNNIFFSFLKLGTDLF